MPSKAKTVVSCEGEEGPIMLCIPRSELRLFLGWREERGEDDERHEKEKRKKRILQYTAVDVVTIIPTVLLLMSGDTCYTVR